MQINNLIRFGTEYGGFYYPENLPFLNENSIVYCFGAGEDITHDTILSSKLNCQVHIFDPNPRAIEHVKNVIDVVEGKKNPIDSNRYGGGDPNYWNMILQNKPNGENIILHEYGLYTKDDILNNVPVKSLNTIMNDLGHKSIDLLKIDVECVECEILDKMLDDNIYPRYISVDFDLIHIDKPKCYETIKKIMTNNYKILKKDGQNMTFILNTPIYRDSEYNGMYTFIDNKFTGICNKDTNWCFTKNYYTPHVGYRYNQYPMFKCCYNNLMYLLKKLNDASKLYNINLFLDYGTLLGCLRNNRIIPWDHDCDLGICDDDIDNFHKAIPFLNKYGKMTTKHGDYVYQLSEKNKIHIDIFVYKKNIKSNKVYYKGPDSIISEDDLKPLKKEIFENIEFLIPNQSKKYIEEVYGKKSIEKPIIKLSYRDNYLNTPHPNYGDLPTKDVWEKYLNVD